MDNMDTAVSKLRNTLHMLPRIRQMVAMFTMVTISCLATAKAQYDKGPSAPKTIEEAAGDECMMLNQVQSVIVQILSAHYEYGNGIHNLHSQVHHLQNDISVLKGELDSIEKTQKSLCDTVFPDKLNQSAISNSVSNSPQNHLLMGEIPNRRYTKYDRAKSQHVLEAKVDNCTTQLRAQSGELTKLYKKYKGLRRTLNKVMTEMTKIQGSNLDQDTDKNEDKPSPMLDHFMGKQKEINAMFVDRLQYLEDNIASLLKQSDSPYAVLQPNGCPKGFVRHFSSCYWFSNSTQDWVDAEKKCQSLYPRSHLAGIETKEEMDFIVAYRNYNDVHWSSSYIWTGGHDMAKTNGWTWVGTGKPFTYTNWRPGEPNSKTGRERHSQNCLYLRTEGHDHKWDDWHCYAAKLNYVCEYLVEI